MDLLPRAEYFESYALVRKMYECFGGSAKWPMIIRKMFFFVDIKDSAVCVQCLLYVFDSTR